MSQKCYDIGTIQAFLDGELSSERLETVSRHVSACDDCAILLAEAEEESALAFSVLENEFNTLVPTNRLWTRINDSIEKQKKPFWHSVFAYFSNPSVAAFASLLVVAGIFAALFILKSAQSENLVAEVVPTRQNAAAPVSKVETSTFTDDKSAQISSEVKDAKSSPVAVSENSRTKYAPLKANFSGNENARLPGKKNISNRNSPRSADAAPSDGRGGNVLGEESYVKTIAALTKTVNVSKDEVLKPAARFAFERDMAVTDDAIKKMKVEVAKNPKNETAKDVLRASYQNKIDLLNSVAEKSELMASLK